MTIWNKIYKDYKDGGEEYATLKGGLIPEFLGFIQTNDFKLKKALDIGCGTGKYLVFLNELGFKTDGLDSSPIAVEMTSKSLENNSVILCKDMYDFELPVNKYDLIISIAAIHHGLKKQVRRTISQIHQGLIPGGHFFVTLPDNEGKSHWTTMSEHEEVEPGTRVPLSGPEKGLPHSSFTRDEINDMFSGFSQVNLQLLSDRGRWIVTGEK